MVCLIIYKLFGGFQQAKTTKAPLRLKNVEFYTYSLS